jgi:hypothetical protein
MKVQYFGDVNDYRKFALLRLLSQVGQFKIGVCWILTEDDASGQGDRRSYLKQPEKWRAYDPATFDALAKAPAAPTINDLRRVEAEALVPNAAFLNSPRTPVSVASRFIRSAWRSSRTRTSSSLTQITGSRSRSPRGERDRASMLTWMRSPIIITRVARSCSTNTIREMFRAKPASLPRAAACELNRRARRSGCLKRRMSRSCLRRDRTTPGTLRPRLPHCRTGGGFRSSSRTLE